MRFTAKYIVVIIALSVVSLTIFVYFTINSKTKSSYNTHKYKETREMLETVRVALNEPVDNNINIIYVISAASVTSTYKSVFTAISNANNNDKIYIMPGIYREKNAGDKWLMTNKKNVIIEGVNKPTIEVEARDKFYQISMQLPYNKDIIIRNIRIKTSIYINNNHVVYGMVLTGSQNIFLSNCTFEAIIYGTNTVFKNFVAINNANNIIIQDSSIITLDKTGSNTISHCATHGSKNILFTNIIFNAENLDHFCIGDATFINCYNENENSTFNDVLNKYK